MEIYVDATALIALGDVGRLELLSYVDGILLVTPAVVGEITTEPANHRLRAVIGDERDDTNSGVRLRQKEANEEHLDAAKNVLGEMERNGDVEIVANVLHAFENDDPVAVVSDDRRVRTVADDFGATVTGTVGVVVRAVHEGLSPDEAKAIVREIDSHGLHLTGELRETAYRLIDEAAEEN